MAEKHEFYFTKIKKFDENLFVQFPRQTLFHDCDSKPFQIPSSSFPFISGDFMLIKRNTKSWVQFDKAILGNPF